MSMNAMVGMVLISLCAVMPLPSDTGVPRANSNMSNLCARFHTPAHLVSARDLIDGATTELRAYITAQRKGNDA